MRLAQLVEHDANDTKVVDVIPIWIIHLKIWTQ